MPIIQKPKKVISLADRKQQLKDLSTKIYSDDEIKNFNIYEAIKDHPLNRRPTTIRSKLAYSEITNNLKPTKKYLLPGQISIFGYSTPKYKEELEYYDATPMTFFFGLIRTKDNTIREVGLNLHYYPPYTRFNVLRVCFNVYKTYFEKQFNEEYHKPNNYVSWNQLKHIMSRDKRLAFGIKMYIPALRGNTYVLPTRLLPTAAYTEGHFSKATLTQVFHFWRQFR